MGLRLEEVNVPDPEKSQKNRDILVQRGIAEVVILERRGADMFTPLLLCRRHKATRNLETQLNNLWLLLLLPNYRKFPLLS